MRVRLKPGYAHLRWISNLLVLLLGLMKSTYLLHMCVYILKDPTGLESGR